MLDEKMKVVESFKLWVTRLCLVSALQVRMDLVRQLTLCRLQSKQQQPANKFAAQKSVVTDSVITVRAIHLHLVSLPSDLFKRAVCCLFIIHIISYPADHY